MTAVRQVELTVGEHSVLLPAMVDTGNLLRDPITGLPVMVVPFGPCGCWCRKSPAGCSGRSFRPGCA